MAKFLLRRLANYVILVAVATSCAYILAAVSLQPARELRGAQPAAARGRRSTRGSTELNLNDKTPVLERYETWAKGVAARRLRQDVGGRAGQRRDGPAHRRQPAAAADRDDRRRRCSASLAGAWGAIRQYQFSDHAVTVAVVRDPVDPGVRARGRARDRARSRFNNAVGTKLFEYTGEFTPGLQGGFWTHVVDRVQHLVLPTLTLILGEIAIFSRYQRNAMLDVLGQDFIRTARAKGLRAAHARCCKHGLRTALIPMATFFAYNFGAAVRRRDVHREDLRLARHGRVVRRLDRRQDTSTPSRP